MKPERWQQIDKILEEALEQEGGQRVAFLDQACGSDDELRKKVDALLAAHEQGDNFLEEPALEVAAEGLAKDHVESLIGKQISSYKILSLLGAGGMGEVFLAQDTTLDRKVALKFLPEELQRDPTARKRFLREAKSAAALDHPFICHIHEVGEADGKDFISMEYVEGETLEEKLKRGPLALKEALEKATEVAEALEEAHKQGIVHRDVKPANIMLTPQGHVKVMDFGLAKRLTPVEGQEQEITTALTQQGSTAGTVPYMSPEQILGEPVDTRSDIFSFGVVLYEMLTGSHPFKGDTSVDTAHAILNEAPPPLTDDLPLLLCHTVKKMLAKETDRRYQSAHEIRTDLAELIEESGDSISEVATGLSGVSSTEAWWQRAIPWSIAGVAVVVASLALWSLTGPTQLPLKKFAITPPVTAPLVNRGGDVELAVSRDGRHIAYFASVAGGMQLYVQSLDEFGARPIPGTEDTDGGDPFFSPDGESVAFFTDNKLKKISLTGGSPITLCDTRPGWRSGSWVENTIVFAAGGQHGAGLYRVSESGGEVEGLVSPDSDEGGSAYHAPQILPGGKSVLFTAFQSSPLEVRYRIEALSLETRERTVVRENARQGYYLATGHLIYEQPSTGNLMAAPFDLASLEVTGDPVLVVQEVRQDTSGVADYAISDNGTLVYVPGGGVSTTHQHSLVWVDRTGRETLVTEEKRDFRSARISPDGKKIAVNIWDDAIRRNVWIYDIEGDTFSRLTFAEEQNGTAVWSPDSQSIVFQTGRRGTRGLARQSADRSSPPERLTNTSTSHMPDSWSPDGRFVAFNESGRPSWDIGILEMEGDAEPYYFLDSSANECCPKFSPDGKWLAYVSDETGLDQVYIRPYPEPDVKWLISNQDEGGGEPVWSPDGTELFYRFGDKMMVVSIQTRGQTLDVGTPQLLFEGTYVGHSTPTAWQYYDISPDGRFFMMKEEGTLETQARINVVLNWFEELKRLVPAN